MSCSGSNIKRSVSDYRVAIRIALCLVCDRNVKITIPDKK